MKALNRLTALGLSDDEINELDDFAAALRRCLVVESGPSCSLARAEDFARRAFGATETSC
jgi:hypothetical protein